MKWKQTGKLTLKVKEASRTTSSSTLKLCGWSSQFHMPDFSTHLIFVILRCVSISCILLRWVDCLVGPSFKFSLCLRHRAPIETLTFHTFDQSDNKAKWARTFFCSLRNHMKGSHDGLLPEDSALSDSDICPIDPRLTVITWHVLKCPLSFTIDTCQLCLFKGWKEYENATQISLTVYAVHWKQSPGVSSLPRKMR